jgi:glycosyltransferase involved in cell wall biosynthesis
MRVLTAFHIGSAGGPHRSLRPIMEWLAQHAELEFLVPCAGPALDDYAAMGQVSVLGYEALTYARGPREGARLGWRFTRETRMFRRELRHRGPDLVIVVTTVLPSLLLAARLEGVPAVVYAAELYDQDWKADTLRRLWSRLLSATTAALAKGLVCCSEAVARQFPARAGAPVVVAYPAIDPAYAEGDRDRGRARLGLDGCAVCLAVIGSLSRGRGQDVALRALPLVRSERPGARLAIVGVPHPRPVDLAFARELHELVARLGLEESVTFVEHGLDSAEMADLYAAADVVVNPARLAEAFGRVAPEALMAGRPVVSTRAGAVPEVIRDETDGLLVAPDDPAALAAAVLRILADPSLAERLVDSGRARVVAKFDADQDLSAWRRVLDPIVSKRSPSG